jgi:hypothetical protein
MGLLQLQLGLNSGATLAFESSGIHELVLLSQIRDSLNLKS